MLQHTEAVCVQKRTFTGETYIMEEARKQELAKQFIDITSEECVEIDADMAQYTSFRAGGKADILVSPADYEGLKASLKLAAASGERYYILGNGTNVLVRDGGYRGIIIRTMDALQEIAIVDEEELVIAQAGALLSKVARSAAQHMLSGLEPVSGVPGSIGGAAFMNAGAYDGEMKDVITDVRLISRDGEREYTLSVDEMDYGYRHSVLYETGDIVVSVMMKLKTDDPHKIFDRMNELAERRNSKQPVDKPSAGSFFKRPTGYFAGKLIQDAGLKGLTVGGAQVSPLHSGFIVNIGGATATDITDLMKLVQARVKAEFGVDMEPEVRIIGEPAE